MCINIALPREVWVENIGQKLAGTGVFVTQPKGLSAYYDDPFLLSIRRLHFEQRHNGEWGEIPDHFTIVNAGRKIPHYEDIDGDIDEDMAAYYRAIMSDSSIGRGFWKSVPHVEYLFPSCDELTDEWTEIVYFSLKDYMEYCTEGQWAAVVQDPWRKIVSSIPVPAPGEPITLGRWHKDGYGCFLSYAIPVGSPIELTGEGFSSGPSGPIYQVGSLAVKIPWGTEWAVWIRCSDTEVHTGFLIVHLEWSEWSKTVYLTPVLASLFKAPHDFPAYGYFFNPKVSELPDFGQDIHAAVQLAEHIAKHGFAVQETQPPEGHIYDTVAVEHAAGNLGFFSLK